MQTSDQNPKSGSENKAERSPHIFEPNEFAFTRQGQRVEVDRRLEGGGYLVRRLYADEEGEPYADERLEFVDELHLQTPTAIFDARLLELEKKIAQRSADLREIEQLNRSNAEVLARLKGRDEVLRELEYFLDMEISHYVLLSSYSLPQIVAFEDMKDPDAKREYRCLTLRSKDGKLFWKVAAYHYDSESSTYAYPVTTYEAAVEKAQGLFDAATSRAGHFPNLKLVKRAQEYGCRLPEGYAEKAAASKREQLEKSVKAAEAQLAQARAKLETEAGNG